LALGLSGQLGGLALGFAGQVLGAGHFLGLAYDGLCAFVSEAQM
jgi:hypothetical protein